MKCIGLMLTILSLAVIAECENEKLSQFFDMEKIDAHMHIRYMGSEVLAQAQKDHFKVFSILTDHYELEPQQNFVYRQMESNPDQVFYITSFTMNGWDEPDWQSKTIAQLKQEFQRGAIGVKVWKNIGMEYKNRDGEFVMIDHPKFDPIINFIESMGKTLIGHIAEPRDCWLPLDSMVAESNRRYYQSNPEYHMYLHKDHPSYDEQILARDNLLAKHTNLRFVGAHLGSMEWNLAELGKRLDRFPNMAVDLAARIDDLQYHDRQEIRDFFIQYQDRILYGSDLSIKENHNPIEFANRMHERWINEWEYLATENEFEVGNQKKIIKGIDLPIEILEKIYRKNAEKWFPEITQKQ